MESPPTKEDIDEAFDIVQDTVLEVFEASAEYIHVLEKNPELITLEKAEEVVVLIQREQEFLEKLLKKIERSIENFQKAGEVAQILKERVTIHRIRKQ